MSGIADVRVNKAFPNVPAGFEFENYRRNLSLQGQNAQNSSIQAKKTGTTICGAIFDGGVVLGADTRATADLIVEKDCEKIHYMAPNIYCCGAGTAADTEYTTSQVSSSLELLRLETNTSESKVCTALTQLQRHLFKYQGHVSAALVLGGVDSNGPHLHTVYPHGSVDTLPFVSMGSGSLAAMSVLESGFRDNLSEEDCVTLVCKAIESGVRNDLGSGNSINYCIIKNKGRDVVMKKGTNLESDLHPVSRKTVEELNVNVYKDKVKLPSVFANFQPGYTVTIGDPLIEKF